MYLAAALICCHVQVHPAARQHAAAAEPDQQQHPDQPTKHSTTGVLPIVLLVVALSACLLLLPKVSHELAVLMFPAVLLMCC